MLAGRGGSGGCRWYGSGGGSGSSGGGGRRRDLDCGCNVGYGSGGWCFRDGGFCTEHALFTLSDTAVARGTIVIHKHIAIFERPFPSTVTVFFAVTGWQHFVIGTVFTLATGAAPIPCAPCGAKGAIALEGALGTLTPGTAKALLTLVGALVTFAARRALDTITLVAALLVAAVAAVTSFRAFFF